MKDLGQLAYEAYGDQVGWHTYDQREMPTWEALAEPQRAGWEAAARAVDAGSRARQVVPTQPTVGRIVHYVSPAGACWAAMVTAVADDGETINMTPFYPPKARILQDERAPVPHDQAGAHPDRVGQPGTWHWPERQA